MKTTIELPEHMLRMAKATAAARGQSLKDFFAEAVGARLAELQREDLAATKPWMKHAGVLRDYADELARIKELIEDEFERIEEEDML